MRVLMLGDVVGRNGTAFVCRRLRLLRERYQPQLVVANGENASEGNGILPADAQDLLDAGVDILTLGNHGLRRREIYTMLEEREDIIRPANLHPEAPGRGWTVYDKPGLPRVAVVNLLGSVYMDWHSSPFDAMDALLPQLDAPIVLVDFHAEATSEKLALGFYLDGRVSAVVGTHTHIQTADERILPGGTGYLTDLGMCGPFQSILGVRPELAIRRLRTGLPIRFENDPGPCRISGVLLTLDPQSGHTTDIQRVNLE